MKLLHNFKSIPFDYLLMSWMTNYIINLGFLTCLSLIASMENSLSRTFRASIRLNISSEFVIKIPVRILFDVLFRVFRFFKASFYLYRHLDTDVRKVAMAIL